MNIFLCGTLAVPGKVALPSEWLSQMLVGTPKSWGRLHQSRLIWFAILELFLAWGLGGNGLSDFSLFIAPFNSGTETADQHWCFFCSYCLFQNLCRRQNCSHSSFQPCHPRAHFPDPFSIWPQKCLGDESLWKDLRLSPAPALGMGPCLQKPKSFPC